MLPPTASAAAYGFAKMQENWADAVSFNRTKFFRDALDSWKQSSLLDRSAGRELKPAPEVPVLIAVDLDKASLRYMESLESGLPIVYDFYIETPLAVAADAFNLDPKPLVAPNDPVGAEDGDPNRFLVNVGAQFKDGDVFTHPVHGKLKFSVKYTPFGAIKRWVRF